MGGAEAARDVPVGPVRVLVVDDSPVCRDLLAELLSTDPGLTLVGMARDGEEALRRTEELRPDVITMDLRMPVMDGVEATRRIMAIRPTPILVLTGHPFQAGRDLAFEALEAGAADLRLKPELGNFIEVERLREDLGSLIRTLAARSAVATVVVPAARELPRRDLSIVAVASSAGGPAAVLQFLQGLPPRFPAGVVVVQHIAEGFDADFARWLDSECTSTVRLAVDGDEVRPGLVLVAPSEAHVRAMPGGRLRLILGAPIAGHRPSADVLLSSAARQHGERAAGVVLSGMGEDGVAGLAEIRACGGLTLAQDEGTAVVWGMPGVAVRRGLVDLVAPAGDLGAALGRACGLAASDAAGG
jgi:two-component system chemotaxis response regulator CheB